MKNLVTALATGCSLALITSAVQAAPYSSLVVFGDSLSDVGQHQDTQGPANTPLRYINRVGPTYLPNSGEITGAVTPMFLSQQLGLGLLTPSTSAVYQNNGWNDGNGWAVGGYRTDQIRDSIIAAGGSTTFERSRDGYLVDLANRGQRVNPNTLFYINGGANDIFQGTMQSIGVQASAQQLTDGIKALQAAGARTIMVALLHDIGANPLLAGTTTGTDARALATQYNSALLSELEQIKAQIIPLNMPLLFDQVLANPDAYGFDGTQDLIGSCFDICTNVNARWGVNSATPDPSKLIYADFVHPSVAMQQIMADYAYSVLAAPWELSLLPEMGHSFLRGHQAQVRQQWRTDWLSWQAPEQWRTFINVGSEQVDFDRQSYSAKSDSEGFGLNVGASYRLGTQWRFGLALGVDDQDLKAGSHDSKYHMRGYLLSGFAQYQSAHWWSDLLLSGGYLDYHDLKRRYQLGIRDMSEKGHSSGQAWGSTWRIGYEFANTTDNWRLSPFVSADYADVKVDSYHESGGGAAALHVAKQSRQSKRLGVGLQGSWQFSEQTQVSAELSRQHEYKDDLQLVRMNLTSVPSLSYQLAGYKPDRDMDQFNLSIKHQLQPALALYAGYNLNRSGDQRQYGVNLGVQMTW